MIAQQKDMKIPSNLIPKCPKCDQPFEINKRNEEKGMVEDADFHAQRQRYENFLSQHQNDKVLYLEIELDIPRHNLLSIRFGDSSL